MSKLKTSLHKFTDEFYNFMIENNITQDDVEFGTWDHFFLSALISFYLKKFAETNTCVPGDLKTSMEDYNKQIMSLATDFLEFSRGSVLDVKQAEIFFQKLMKEFTEHYRGLWN